MRREGEGREIKAGAEGVMFGFTGGEMLSDFGIRGGHEGSHRGGLAGGAAQDFRGERGPAMQPFAVQNAVFGSIIGITEVREDEPRWLACPNVGVRSIPDTTITVRAMSGLPDDVMFST